MKKIFDKTLINQKKLWLRELELLPEKMVECGQLYFAPRGKTLVYQSSQPDFFYVLVEGELQLRMMLPSGKLITIRTVKEPAMIGEMELLEIRKTLEVSAQSDSMLFRWPLEEAKEFLINDVAFLQKLVKSVVLKERDAIERLVMEKGFSADVRLARLILENSVSGVFGLRKSEAAAYLGISYRHTEKLFSDFLVNGLLRKNGRFYEILDAERLTEIAREIENMS